MRVKKNKRWIHKAVSVKPKRCYGGRDADTQLTETGQYYTDNWEANAKVLPAFDSFECGRFTPSKKLEWQLWTIAVSEDCKCVTVVYYANPKNAEEFKALRNQGARNVEAGIKSFKPRRPYIYPKRWVSNPHGNPVRQYWIDRLTEVGYFDAPGVVQV